jgi:hypothetical protein
VSVLLIAIGLALLATPAVLGGLGRRMSPPEWCRAVVACLRMGRLAVHAGLWFAFGPVALRALGAHELAHACHRMFAAGLYSPDLAGWLAGGALGASALRAHATRRGTSRSLQLLRSEPWLGEHRLDDGVDLVTLPCAEPLAYAIPGCPDQITVTEGLAAVLDGEELDAVLRHEHAHLRLRHHDALALGCDIEARFGWFGPVRGSVAGLRLAVERWADEDASSVSDAARPAVRRALLKTVAVALGPVPAFTDVDTVAARLDALAVAPPRPGLRIRLAAAGPMLALSVLAVGAIGGCAVVAHHGIDGVLGHCPF